MACCDGVYVCVFVDVRVCVEVMTVRACGGGGVEGATGPPSRRTSYLRSSPIFVKNLSDSRMTVPRRHFPLCISCTAIRQAVRMMW